MEKAVDQKESVAPNQQSRIEVADIFRHYIGDYQKVYKLHPDHYKVINDILECRTAILGGHIYSCTECGHRIHVYNSCGNRHCPKCQTTAKARWLEDRKSELLPVPYFHVVFTLPHDINPLALCNKRQLYTLLFKAASETLLSFGENPENGLGGKLGLISILHTWDQTLNDHIHLHCLVPGGVLTDEKDEFKVSNESYLFPVQALSKTFRAKYMDKTEKMTLDAIEFIRRFLLHVVPRNFMRIRHFGLFANRCKKKNISLCQALLNAGKSNTASIQKSVEDIMYALTGEDIRCCPVCKKGVMVKGMEIPKYLFGTAGSEIIRPPIIAENTVS